MSFAQSKIAHQLYHIASDLIFGKEKTYTES